jgi:hypothetical protein
MAHPAVAEAAVIPGTTVGKFDKQQLRARYSNNELDIHRVK